MHEVVRPIAGISGASLSLHVLGDAWVLRILRTSFRGARRFSDHMRALEVSRAVLTDRLNRMCSDGLLEKVEQQGSHPEYRLTEMSLDLWSAFIAMWQWECHWGTGVDTSAPALDRPRSRLIHLNCNQAIEPVYLCGKCLAEVSPFDTYGEATDGDSQESVTKSCEDTSRKRYRKSSAEDRAKLTTLLKVYGDRWNASLMAAAFLGKRTFSEFSAVTGIWPTALSDRLEELRSIGMLRAHSYAGSRQEYRLTRSAVAMYPITLELIRWGDRWMAHDEPQMRVMHQSCGHALQAYWSCPCCHQALQRTTVQFQ